MQPSLYTYSAICEIRCEVVCLPRSAILEVLNSFSPWLGDRFKLFQERVLENYENNFAQNQTGSEHEIISLLKDFDEGCVEDAEASVESGLLHKPRVVVMDVDGEGPSPDAGQLPDPPTTLPNQVLLPAEDTNQKLMA